MDNELDAVRKDYLVFTAIEQQLKDGNRTLNIDFVDTVLKVIEQHKADLFAKYNI